jgi:hypothetical protein
MSMRRFRARLDRLEKMANARDCGFTVDPMLAGAVRELNDLLGSRDDLPGQPRSEHEKQLQARIVERAKAIGCPAGYGAEQARKDGHRLEALLSKRRSPRRRGGPPRNSLSAAEYAEEARLTWWHCGIRPISRRLRAGADRRIGVEIIDGTLRKRGDLRRGANRTRPPTHALP